MDLSTWYTVLLGFVEGLTEYLPVSSTGHLLLVQAWLGLSGEENFSFTIAIQLGAILAVLVHYRAFLGKKAVGLWRRDEASWALVKHVAVAFAPTAVAGLLLRKVVKHFLTGPKPVALALLVGGLVMMAASYVYPPPVTGRTPPPAEKLRFGGLWRGPSDPILPAEASSLDRLTSRQAFWIGVGQCFALWPGMSRSMVTLLAGQFVGLSLPVAAEFSFLLALPTLGAATALEVAKSWRLLFGSVYATAQVGLGLVISFLVAWATIAFFLGYLKRYGLWPFGVYRVVLAVCVYVSVRGV